MKILLVAGARPNFMKIAPIAHALAAKPEVTPLIVHTGQHYDEAMSKVFFDELAIPRPDVNLGVGSGTHATQVAEIMTRFEPLLDEEQPDWVVVVGDVNSTLACSLVATKKLIPVAHVEAGLRSFDDRMPEEVNRKLTDAVSDLLLVSEPSGLENLKSEGVPDERVRFVGNVMIDTLLRHRDHVVRAGGAGRFGRERGSYALVTLHRPANVDDRDVLSGILSALTTIAARVPVVLPLHPRTEAALTRFGMLEEMRETPGLDLMAPLGYLDFLALMTDAMAVLTDSGGIQEETTVLSVPCITMRENTERPVTVTQGTNTVVGRDPGRILTAFEEVLSGAQGSGRIPDLWDGAAAERIVAILISGEVGGRWRDT